MIIGYSGCLLPLLIVLNLFFGRTIFKPQAWFVIEAVLIFLLLLNAYTFSRRLKSRPRNNPPENVIDVEGKVVEDK